MAAVSHTIPELDHKGLRKFGIETGAISAGLFGLFFPWVLGIPWGHWPAWAWILFVLFGAWGLVAPMSLRREYRGWIRFGLLMSRVTTPVVMGAVFFLITTPVALLWKVIRKDAMVRKFDNSSTYPVPSRKTPAENLKKPF